MTDLYLLRRLLPSIGLAVVVATAAVLLLLLLRFGPGLLSAGATPGAILSLAATATVPAASAAIGPAALFGGVVVLARLWEDGELLALSSLGMGPGRLSRAPLAIVLVVAIVTATLSFAVEPRILSRLRGSLAEVAVDAVTRTVDGSRPGRLVSPAPGVVVYRAPRGGGLLVDADGPVVVARRGRARSRGTALEISLVDAHVRSRPDEYLSAERLELLLPLGDVAREAGAVVPDDLVRPTSALVALESTPRARRALARRIAAPVFAALLAIWMIPIGFRRLGRGVALALAAVVVAVGHVAFRISETATTSPWGHAVAPTLLAAGAVLTWRGVSRGRMRSPGGARRSEPDLPAGRSSIRPSQ